MNTESIIFRISLLSLLCGAIQAIAVLVLGRHDPMLVVVMVLVAAIIGVAWLMTKRARPTRPVTAAATTPGRHRWRRGLIATAVAFPICVFVFWATALWVQFQKAAIRYVMQREPFCIGADETSVRKLFSSTARVVDFERPQTPDVGIAKIHDRFGGLETDPRSFMHVETQEPVIWGNKASAVSETYYRKPGSTGSWTFDSDDIWMFEWTSDGWRIVFLEYRIPPAKVAELKRSLE